MYLYTCTVPVHEKKKTNVSISQINHELKVSTPVYLYKR